MLARKKPILSPAALAVGLTVAILVGGTLQAQEQEGQPQAKEESLAGAEAPSVEEVASNLKLHQTHIRTHDNLLPLSSTLTDAFTPIRVQCPRKARRGCTIRTVVSSQFWSVDPGTVARMRVQILGAGNAVAPSSLVNVDSTTSGFLASTTTFQWMKEQIPANSVQTVDVDFQVSSGLANGGFRTVTVELYKN